MPHASAAAAGARRDHIAPMAPPRHPATHTHTPARLSPPLTHTQISTDATDAEIKRAYRKLSLQVIMPARPACLPACLPACTPALLRACPGSHCCFCCCCCR